MDAVFSRFDSYDFDADQRFQDGLKTLTSADDAKVLDMKLFFYNRFVEPIDRSSYRHRSSARDQAAFPGAAATTTASEEEAQLSFAEVMRLVQEGKEVPGVRQLDVAPTNESPAPSRMERMQKPWETSSAAK